LGELLARSSPNLIQETLGQSRKKRESQLQRHDRNKKTPRWNCPSRRDCFGSVFKKTKSDAREEQAPPLRLFREVCSFDEQSRSIFNPFIHLPQSFLKGGAGENRCLPVSGKPETAVLSRRGKLVDRLRSSFASQKFSPANTFLTNLLTHPAPGSARAERRYARGWARGYWQEES
jgi:hypothetical protein